MHDLWGRAAKRFVAHAEEQAAKRTLKADQRVKTEEEHHRLPAMNGSECFAFCQTRPDDDAPSPPGA